MRPRAAVAAGGAIALVVSLAACSKNTGEGVTVDIDRRQTGVIATDPKDSTGPAPAVPGAQAGGTFTIIRETPIAHLDPQRTYSFVGLLAAPLFARFLTTWKDDGAGNLVLVGDLAETPGNNVNDDCKLWEFKIKDGVKFEDGRPVTSKEIAYGIARSFDPDLAGGPTYLQEWLADNPQYDTVWDFTANRTGLPPGLSTPDERTLRFEFAKPRCDLPFAASLPSTAPLPPDKDTGINLGNAPFSSGPYKVTRYQAGVEVVLERNEHWDAATDPVRHQYPERFVWTFGPTPDAAANRVIADSGADQSALSWNYVPASLVSRVVGDAALRSRTILSPTPSANHLVINNRRVTDLRVRQALNYAIDREGLVKVLGGQHVAAPMTTLMPSSTIGHRAYDAYPAGLNGELEKARELLGGQTPELVLGAADSAVEQQVATQLKGNLERAGFKITIRNIPDDAKLDEIKKRDNPWDLYLSSWAADWPSGASILPVLYDGRSIRAEGNSNESYFNDPAINVELDRILALPPTEQGPEWAKLDERIMKEHAPVVPLYVDVAYLVHGSKVGGIFVSSVFGFPSLVNAHVKP
ncbi:peptide/nickel transport system substrate-binding protein [Micromonospora phaseoli]|uniref:Peptide/nickel transport system substrate-binding protein n=1 Tax=Micromonospora phaseoli TaxID=1144548 RepID=A0A1H6WRQ1_9ACTN|nr:ABC transporter substrate-binding protein [Micromonospora phaseoli]PZW01926.1 peptide/nickel transport system substrate-binding protein [Micromonospora phaseoli]GIJ80628.1 ABC transporter [Micromonospora phaseoli]SEJ19689.1 peptide/nickel transport system substrate-binding protein [Micromonospora phaseoli]